MGGFPWTADETALLQEHITTVSPRDLVALLPGRTEPAIRQRCKKLGLLRGYWHLPAHQELPSVPLVDAVYLAGHFDGEGCILMRASGKSYKVACVVTGAWVPTLHKYQSYFGGSIGPTSGYTNKPLHRWNLSGYSANLFFLETLVPYLSEKAAQAHIALEFIRLRIQASHAYPGENIKQRAYECYRALQAAKKAS
jgi:hypothetical protein